MFEHSIHHIHLLDLAQTLGYHFSTYCHKRRDESSNARRRSEVIKQSCVLLCRRTRQFAAVRLVTADLVEAAEAVSATRALDDDRPPAPTANRRDGTRKGQVKWRGEDRTRAWHVKQESGARARHEAETSGPMEKAGATTLEKEKAGARATRRTKAGRPIAWRLL